MINASNTIYDGSFAGKCEKRRKELTQLESDKISEIAVKCR